MDKQDSKVYNVDFKRKERDKMTTATANYNPVDLYDEHYSLEERARRALLEESDTSDEIDNRCDDVGDFMCFTDEQIRDDEVFMESRRYSRHQGAGNAEQQHNND